MTCVFVVVVVAVFCRITVLLNHHRESWDLSKLSPPVAAAVTASRVLWSAQSGGRDAADAVGKAAAESLQSLSSQDEDEYYMNPNDPTRVSGGAGMKRVRQG